jgi:hypothetical protein
MRVRVLQFVSVAAVVMADALAVAALLTPDVCILQRWCAVGSPEEQLCSLYDLFDQMRPLRPVCGGGGTQWKMASAQYIVYLQSCAQFVMSVGTYRVNQGK